MSVKDDYICQTCKHFDHKEDCCWSARDMFFNEDEHFCIYWEDEVELTEDEKAGIRGDIEAHRIMVEGREIE